LDWRAKDEKTFSDLAAGVALAVMVEEVAAAAKKGAKVIWLPSSLERYENCVKRR